MDGGGFAAEEGEPGWELVAVGGGFVFEYPPGEVDGRGFVFITTPAFVLQASPSPVFSCEKMAAWRVAAAAAILAAASVFFSAASVVAF